MNPKYKNVRFNKALGLVCLMILSAASTQAVDIQWTHGTASYNPPADWAGGVVPGPADNAIVTNGATVLINPADPNWTVNDIRAGDTVGSGAWVQDGPTVTLNGWF